MIKRASFHTSSSLLVKLYWAIIVFVTNAFAKSMKSEYLDLPTNESSLLKMVGNHCNASWQMLLHMHAKLLPLPV